MTTKMMIAIASLAGCVPMGNGMWQGASYGGGSTSSSPQGQANTVRAPENLTAVGAAKSLARLTTGDEQEIRPTLDADGKKLLAVSWRDEVVDGQATGGTIDQMIVGLRPDGRGRTPYSRRGAAHSPGWLPGGKFIYVSNAMGSWQLVRAAKAQPGSAVSVIVRADDAPGISSVSASRDGSLIAFQTNVRDVLTIGTVHPDGSELMMLTEGANPKISPDGKRIAFERPVNGVWHIFTMDVDGGDLTQVTEGDATEGSADWSPDGKWLVYASNAGYQRFPNGASDTTFNLFAIHPDGTGATQLTDGPRKSTDACWGADGWIYFASNEAGNFDLWRVKVPAASLD